MSAGNFPLCYGFTLGYERGFSNNPLDPGCATQDGITQAVYDDDRDRRHLPRQDVRLSTEAERRAIYQWRYWDMVSGELLPAGVDYAVFDFAVNSGIGRAVRTLQGIVGTVMDGNLGPRTMAAVQLHCSAYGATSITDAICHSRMTFLRSLVTFSTFGRGWTRRVMGQVDGTQSGDTGVIDRAYDMAQGKAPTTPTAQVATPKTYLPRAA